MSRRISVATVVASLALVATSAAPALAWTDDDYAKVTGHVTGRAGQPIANAMVNVKLPGDEGDFSHGEAFTDSNGSFTIYSEMNNGPFRVRVKAPGYVDTWNGNVTSGAAEIEPILETDGPTIVDIAAVPTPSVLGKVTTANGTALSQVDVTSYVLVDGVWTADWYTRTDTNGNYLVVPSKSNQVRLSFVREDYPTLYWPNATTISAATTITVGEADVTGINAVLGNRQTVVTPTVKPTPPKATTISSVVKKIQVGKKAKLPTKTKAGTTLKWKSLTPGKCKIVKGNRVKGVKKGTCKIIATAPGTASVKKFSHTYKVKVRKKK